MVRFLKDGMSSISSHLYEEILKLSKSHRNRIKQIVRCKTALMNTYYMWVSQERTRYYKR